MATVSATGVSASAKETVTIMAAGVGLIVLLYWLAKREVKGAVAAVGNVVAPVVASVNPANPDNIVQKIGTAVVRLSDQKNAQQGLTLSTKIVDWFDFGGVNSYDPNADAPKG